MGKSEKVVSMGILDRFEQRVDRLVNGAFAKAFSAEVQPVEIAAALQSEVDDRAIIVGAGRTVVPNSFVIDLSSADYQRLNSYAAPLKLELEGVLREHITEQRYTTLGLVSVNFELDPELATGIFRINAAARDSAGQAVEQVETAASRRGPHIVIDGFSHPLTRQRTVLGRGTDADIRIDDNGVSRQHCEIVLSSPPLLRDLSSTNGTWVQGQRITELTVSSDVDINIGSTTIQFRMR
jgi:pSer/pThr/pTyr-binding forkhead associated (FHA) protein